MAFTTKQSTGFLPTSRGDLYTCPAATTTLIKTLTIVNRDSSAVTINLYILKAAGNAKFIIPVDMSLDAYFSMIFDETITLESGDKLQGDCSSLNSADYSISYIEEA